MTQLCTFKVGDLYFGVDVLRVQEVIREQEMTPVPLAHGVITGLSNLRGQIVTAIDMRARLNLKKREFGEDVMNVILTSDEGALSLLVDEIGDVIEVKSELFERPPGTLQSPVKNIVTGVHKLEGSLLLEVDPEAIAELHNVEEAS